MDPGIATRLNPLGLRPAFVELLSHLITPDIEQLRQHPPIAAMFATLCAALGGPTPASERFETAWLAMYATIGRLDSLQDGDPLSSTPQLASAGMHYNLVFASYVLAAGLLDDLGSDVEAERVLRLQRHWNDALLRMADGQQQDLASGSEPRSFEALALYQQIAQAKTGATYALAFGGLTTLLSDDTQLITALTQVGELYGTLIQYVDDFHDAAEQPNSALTLPALLPCLPLAAPLPPERLATAFWTYLYPIYLQAAHNALTPFPTLQRPIANLFATVFAPQPAP